MYIYITTNYIISLLKSYKYRHPASKFYVKNRLKYLERAARIALLTKISYPSTTNTISLNKVLSIILVKSYPKLDFGIITSANRKL